MEYWNNGFKGIFDIEKILFASIPIIPLFQHSTLGYTRPIAQKT
jgi:hypothetical protein